MKIIGIDASTTCSGIGVIEDGKLVYHGTINMRKNKNSYDRVTNMMYEIGAFIIDVKPDCVYIEDSWTGKNAEITKMLSNIIGAVMYVCKVNDINFTKLNPSLWRSAVGITLDKKGKKVKRDELKKEAVKRVKRIYKIDCEDDEAEGICIAEAGWILQANDLFE